MKQKIEELYEEGINWLNDQTLLGFQLMSWNMTYETHCHRMTGDCLVKLKDSAGKTETCLMKFETSIVTNDTSQRLYRSMTISWCLEFMGSHEFIIHEKMNWMGDNVTDAAYNIKAKITANVFNQLYTMVNTIIACTTKQSIF